MIIVEDPVTVKCRTAIKAWFLSFNFCVMLGGLSCSVTSISFLTNLYERSNNVDLKMHMRPKFEASILD
jgi:hypothetical protein